MLKPFVAATPNFDRLAAETHEVFAVGRRRVDTFYQHTYPIILRAFSKLSFDGSEQDFEYLQICILLVYSWMSPARLDKGVHWSHYQAACRALHRLKHDGTCDKHSLNNIVRLVNNSVVGASKFLHFVAPAYFPIWDQHVARYFNLKYWKKYEDIDLYLAYVDWLRVQSISDDAVRRTTEVLGVVPEGQQLRCKEFLLFQAGLKLKHT